MDNGNKPINVINDLTTIGQMGLTKREYFAGLAMQGLMTSQNQDGDWKHDIKSCAEISIRMADTLLLELSKSN